MNNNTISVHVYVNVKFAKSLFNNNDRFSHWIGSLKLHDEFNQKENQGQPILLRYLWKRWQVMPLPGTLSAAAIFLLLPRSMHVFTQGPCFFLVNSHHIVQKSNSVCNLWSRPGTHLTYIVGDRCFEFSFHCYWTVPFLNRDGSVFAKCGPWS